MNIHTHIHTHTVSQNVKKHEVDERWNTNVYVHFPWVWGKITKNDEQFLLIAKGGEGGTHACRWWPGSTFTMKNAERTPVLKSSGNNKWWKPNGMQCSRMSSPSLALPISSDAGCWNNCHLDSNHRMTRLRLNDMRHEGEWPESCKDWNRKLNQLYNQIEEQWWTFVMSFFKNY